ncbi:lysophospholipase L1-like esterase [Arcticibacter tournemirensis]|uniref:Rhamnogalacturonan acetylesterase n=1 Tax=Arcticibacter tournemirensis TaxID=699437 RepID=A0A5M9H8A3_9SPHI|nr:rhamnogalacturonan acetylesterase [Arcticibacter tournemirensis]KAA8481408.1 rhamnogalacturonan acetylesterase [Arcticibacter tournemirensis]TQM48993.1 lysophospholipase L1-like esterase [Arcticibacter tournemirensis]
MDRNMKGLLCLVCCILMSFVYLKKEPVKVYLIGDSTVADYSLEPDYKTRRYPLTGWGQVFQQFLRRDNLVHLKGIIHADSAVVDDRAKGGRSTRTFFEEGRWAEVYKLLKKNDVVMIQFGHNDASAEKPERYVNITGYKEYLRLFINQSRSKRAWPVLITPVTRNYPWNGGKLGSAHGDYPQAMEDVAKELRVPLINLTKLSADYFTMKGQDYVTSRYFMNLPAGAYEAYPGGQKDNTHFQTEGATEVARLVFQGLKKLSGNK